MALTTLQSQEFTSSGTFNVPTGITSVWVSLVGGGGGGAGIRSDTNAAGRGGGGAGEYALMVPYKVTSGGTVAVTIGAGGAGGIGNFSTGSEEGSSGGDTFFGTLCCKGGGGATAVSSVVVGGTGGGVGANLDQSLITDQIMPRTVGKHTAGGNGGKQNLGIAYMCAPCINFPPRAAMTGIRPSGDGASSPWGYGGRGVPELANGNDAPATSYGAGGAGAGGTGTPVPPFPNGGNGASGYVLVQWIG